MFRWLGLAVVLVALVSAACGRQVTGLNAPNAGSIQPGHMLIRFRVAGPLDFTNVQYLIVFNTSGNGGSPHPAPQLSGYLNYSFALVVGGSQYTSTPLLFQYYLAPSGIQDRTIILPAQFYNYVPDSGGNPTGGEFTINFARSLLNEPPPTAGATPNPNVQPTTTAQHFWSINFTTATAVATATSLAGTPIDSMGPGGPTDTQFQYKVDTTQPVDYPYTKPPGTGSVANLGAQLQGFEVINAP